MGKWYVSEINSALRLMKYEVVIKEKEKIVDAEVIEQTQTEPEEDDPYK